VGREDTLLFVRACLRVTWIDPHSRLSNDLASAQARGFSRPRAPRPQLACDQSLLSTLVHVCVDTYTPIVSCRCTVKRMYYDHFFSLA
jgi:hypothetical protein